MSQFFNNPAHVFGATLLCCIVILAAVFAAIEHFPNVDPGIILAIPLVMLGIACLVFG